MKRSEMVINIAIEIMSNFPELKKQERRKIADEILQCIEINGMLPPQREDQFCDMCGEPKDNLSWEPEDAVS